MVAEVVGSWYRSDGDVLFPRKMNLKTVDDIDLILVQIELIVIS